MKSISFCLLSASLLFLAVFPAVLGRKCYVCNSQFQPGCADAYQLSQLYQDCSQQGQFGGQQQQQQFGPQQFQQPGAQFGGGVQQYGGGDRCFKMTVVSTQQGQPMITRGCGAPSGSMMMQPPGDSCVWSGNVQSCVCESNYCNGSKRLSAPSSYFAGLIVVLGTLISYGCR